MAAEFTATLTPARTNASGLPVPEAVVKALGGGRRHSTPTRHRVSFSTLSISHRRSSTGWIAGAKQSETRARRGLRRPVEMLRGQRAQR